MSAEHPGGTGKKHLCTETTLNLLVLDVHSRNQATGVTDEWDLRSSHIESNGPDRCWISSEWANSNLTAEGRQSEPFPYNTAVVEGHPGGAQESVIRRCTWVVLVKISGDKTNKQKNPVNVGEGSVGRREGRGGGDERGDKQKTLYTCMKLSANSTK